MKVKRILRLVFGACGVMLLWPSLAPADERPPLGLRVLDLRMDERFNLAQATPPAAVPSAPVEPRVLGEFDTREQAEKFIATKVAPGERANMTLKPVAREKTRLYFGPYATRLEAEAAAKKVDTNFLRYQILQDDQSSGFIISFGAFADEARLRAVGRVASSFGLGEGKATPVIHEGYQVVRKTAAEATAQESPPLTIVPGLKFDELFVDETSPTQAGEESTPSSLFWQDLRWSGYLKNETAYRYHEPRSITKIRNVLYLNAQYPLIDNRVDLFFAGWAYHDLAYDLFNYDTIAARSERNDDEPLVFVERLDEEKDSSVADIRELYADLFFDKLDLRVGKQYIVWGVLEGVRVVDEVNPIDFRELIMPDLLDYRIPLWSLKMDYTGESAGYQFIWIPDLRFNKPAPRGSEWEMLQDVCVGQAVTILCVNDRPQSWTLQDSEVGIKIDKTWLDTEFTLNYLYTWDDFPVVFRTVRVDSTQIPPAYFPAYTRIQLWGGTAVKQMGRYIVKGELAYVSGKYFGIKNSADSDRNGYVDYDGELQRDHIRWGAGIEFNFLGMDISPGMTQWIILGHDSAMMQDKYDTSFNLFLRKEIPAQSAVFQMLMIYLVNMDETLWKPKMTYQIDDHLQLAVGLDIFYGIKSDFGASAAAQSATSTFDPSVARAQFFGNFHDNDRIYFEFKYSF